MNYRNLEVWKRSLDLTADIYRLTKQLPKEELFGLSDLNEKSSRIDSIKYCRGSRQKL